MNLNENFEQKKSALTQRYELQRVAQSVLAKKGLEWKDQHRTCWCSRSLRHGDYGQQGGGFVGVFRNVDGSGASLTGLNRCGNRHTCPVCAAKVSEICRKQLSAAMVQQVANGGTAYLITKTFPHEAADTLDDLLKKFTKARTAFKNSGAWKKFRKSANVVGVVTSLEFTVSLENGWHPHVHMLVFCKKQAFGEGDPINKFRDLQSHAIEEFSKQWCGLLFKNGLGDQSKLTDMLNHAFNVRGGEKAAEYIAKFGRDEKWGASAELAKAHAKVGAAGERWGVQHFTPFQLLIWAGQGDGWAVHRFREYAEAVQGKQAIGWTPGLKKALNVADIDEELWAQTDDTPPPEQVQVGSITAEQFAVIMSRKHLPQFIQYVADCCNDQSHLDEYVEMLLDSVDVVASGALLVKRKSGRAVAYA